MTLKRAGRKVVTKDDAGGDKKRAITTVLYPTDATAWSAFFHSKSLIFDHDSHYKRDYIMIIHGKRQALCHSVKDISCGKVVYRKLQLSNCVRTAKVSCHVMKEMERTGEAEAEEPPSDAELEMEEPAEEDEALGIFDLEPVSKQL